MLVDRFVSQASDQGSGSGPEETMGHGAEVVLLPFLSGDCLLVSGRSFHPVIGSIFADHRFGPGKITGILLIMLLMIGPLGY